MTSQTWLSPEEVSRSQWWHILVVVVPHKIRDTDTAMLWVTDGSNKDDFLPDFGAQFDYNLLVAADKVLMGLKPNCHTAVSGVWFRRSSH